MDLTKLEEHVVTSQTCLVFLSKGYFFSSNSTRELAAAINSGVPLILVHETEMTHGGALLDELRADCANDMRTAVFGSAAQPSPVIPWYRQLDFQLVSLKAIATMLLHASPAHKGRSTSSA